jgi:CHAT domain-containing protein/Tfp pilus assembly protein PilF
MNWLRILVILSLTSVNYISAQDTGVYNLFLRFADLYNSGDLVNAEKCMLTVLESKDSLSETYLVAAYNNLGATYTLWGKYNDALKYYNLAEDQITEKQQALRSLADIYNNKSRIYTYQKSFPRAIEYLEKSIRIYQGISRQDTDLFYRISTAYLNIGIVYYEIKDYQLALDYFTRSAELKEKFNLSRPGLSYDNIAKTYVKLCENDKAEEYFKKGIKSYNEEFGEDFFRMAELFFDYGQFLASEGRDPEALEIFNRASSICIESYGEKNSLVSLSYKHLGDFYLNREDCDSALHYYQKALIAVVNDFNDPDIHSNPSVGSSLYDITLLDVLKSKSEAFKLLSDQMADQRTRIDMMKKSYETVDLALQTINRMRSDYLTRENRLYLAENEKETYIYAIDIANDLYTITGDQEYLATMFDIATQAKAAILRSEITDNELFYSIGLPDSLQQKHTSLLTGIESYNNLMQEETQKPEPDKKKMDYWKDVLFDMKNDFEMLEKDINNKFPEYSILLQKTEPISLEELQENLKNDESVIEYFLSNKKINGKRKLYIFTVTKSRLNFYETGLDSAFFEDIEIIRKGTVQNQNAKAPLDVYKDYTGALFNMYNRLIKPVETTFPGEKLIIVPDEEISYLPFDAFLKSSPDPDRINYEGLDYLIRHYTCSFGFSSSLIFSKENKVARTKKIYAFAPDYSNGSVNYTMNSEYLGGAVMEISSILRWFKGKEYFGSEASETNFKSVMPDPAILHLAMHSMTDPDNSRYSFLMFDRVNDTLEDGRLYNYEISISRINSPMVVLSACNTGSGTLSRGEGIMSMARSFILAGASSVVRTFWDINDDASEKIMTDFYYHLSMGRPKDESLRLAKLAYLNTAPPAYVNPWYWAAYSVTGDREPVTGRNRTGLLIASGVLILVTVLLVGYLRRRKRFPAFF